MCVKTKSHRRHVIPAQKSSLRVAADYAIILIFLILGMGSLIRSMGASFLFVPGDLLDARFNNYVLEHVWQWLSGRVDALWETNFYYPYPMVFAFSDNLLGSAPFYAAVRAIGFSRESAFQFWYLFGYLLNYLSAAFVLRRLRLSPLAVGTGAFFFAFGLPMFAQEGHPQLVYRCCIPLACYFLWSFARRPRLWKTLVFLAALTWQFFFTVYMGFFLSLMAIALFCAIPFCPPSQTLSETAVLPLKDEPVLRRTMKKAVAALRFWPGRLRDAWRSASSLEKVFCLMGFLFCLALLWALFGPYLAVSKLYGFGRGRDDVANGLPRLGSYLIADRGFFGLKVLWDLPSRHEHQLFPGLGVCLLVLISLLWKNPPDRAGFRRSHLMMLGLLMLLTLSVGGKSLYFFFYDWPGFNSIRAVNRIQLALMWPLAVMAAFSIDVIRRADSGRFRFDIVLGVLVALTLAESLFYPHVVYSKIEGQERVAALRRQTEMAIEASGVADPVLVVRHKEGDTWMANAIDTMLVSQETGIPTINGYSGNGPAYPIMEWMHSCETLPGALDFYSLKAEEFTGLTDLNIRQRIIPLNYIGCVPDLIRSP